MMERNMKRERNTNFSREETENLISLIETYKNIIENKKSDAATWQEKEKAWKAIEFEYNSCGVGVYRDARHLKLKYEAIKRDTRKKANHIAQQNENGSSINKVPPLTPAEQKVKRMLSLSIEDSESCSNSDQNMVSEKPQEKRPFDKLVEAKLEVVELRKKIIEEELQEKLLKKQMLKDEMTYKKELFELEKEERLLKIAILKNQR
ncbi:myb/SANT-like DNA-binding domain-containing protein 3 isoform X1 [Ostrinia furnacalis]|uniref:myb/SANT-like DNA-binding domain-containing protein 3 isoform X1 n=1 Tax=Ostrinia furnacalis TaxID=93504 RepID=UPI00103C2CDD|nr:myb/SANT-like DNA-binding domain-containing protein 3 isoform X1 [Ostrinia furnacalis]